MSKLKLALKLAAVAGVGAFVEALGGPLAQYGGMLVAGLRSYFGL